MRAITLLLIVANLGYLGWATLVDVRTDAPTAAASPTDPTTQRLMLAAERNSITATAAARSQKIRDNRASRQTAAAPAKLANTGPKCISIGPFQDLTSATQASATLNSTGSESRQRLEQGQLWVGYWVNIPGFSKRDDADRAVTRLKQNGITDAYVSLSGAQADSSTIISLGVFKDAERAQRLLTEAKALGFTAQISDRTRAGSVYWVDVDFSGVPPDIDFSTLGTQPGKILRLEQRACPSGAN
jgi:cell division septation protein DedD